MNICHAINIVTRTTRRDYSYINGKSESPNKTLENIKRDLLMNFYHKKELWYLA